jgi:ADP-ribosyltransferase exoenzyme
MPQLRLKSTGALEEIPENAVQQALATGLYEAPGLDVAVPIVRDIPGEDRISYLPIPLAEQEHTARPAAEAELRAAERATRIEREHGGVGGAIATGVESALDTATFGGYGALTDVIWGDDYTEARRERREANPEAGIAGTIAGAVAPALLSGGGGAAGALARATPAGMASRLGARIAEGGVARAATGYAVEGALYGAGHVLSESILYDKELSAEAFLAGAKEGALWGGLGGVGATLLSSGARAGRQAVDRAAAGRAVDGLLEAEAKAATKEAARAQKEVERLKREHGRHLNRVALEELKQKGRLELATARGSARTEVAEIGAETRLKIADKRTETELAKAEAAAITARARADKASEALKVEQARLERAKLVMDGRIQLADTYTAGWRRAADSRETVAASKLEAAELGADAKMRTGFADALVKSGREDAGYLIEELIPAKLRTPQAAEAAKGEVLNQTARVAAATDDLVRQADELMAINPALETELRALRDRAAAAAPAARDWADKQAGAIRFQEDNLEALRAAGFNAPEAAAQPAAASGIPRHAEMGIDDDILRTVPIAELQPHLVSLEGVIPGRMESIRAGLAEGKAMPPVDLNVLPNGKLFVNDGRHRLRVAAERGDPVEVRFSRGAEGADFGTKPLFPTTPDEAASAPATSAADLEDPFRFLPVPWEQAEEVFGAIAARATPEQRMAATIYSDASGNIAGNLRGRAPDPDDIEAYLESRVLEAPGKMDYSTGQRKVLGQMTVGDAVEQLDSLVAQSPAPRDVLVYRGVSGDHVPDYKVGDVIQDKSFQSSSLMSEKAEFFAREHKAGRTVLEIEVPEGSPLGPLSSSVDGGPFGSGEVEFLLPRDQKLRVTYVTEGKDGIRRVRARVDAPDSAQPRASAAAPDTAVESTIAVGDEVAPGVFAGQRRDPILPETPLGTVTEEAVVGGKPVRFEVETSRTSPEHPVQSHVRAFDGDTVIGEARLSHFETRAEMYPNDVAVIPAWQRRGVASKMYDLAESTTGRRMVASATQTPAGRGLSSSFRGRRDAAPTTEFQTGLDTVRAAEQAQYDLAQAIRPYLDDVSGMSLDDALAGMDEAIGKQDEIVTGAVLRQAEAKASLDDALRSLDEEAIEGAIGPAPGAQPRAQPRAARRGGAAGEGVAVLDLVAGVGGLPNADDIPVIGPLLSVYLKYRAVTGALNRLGIRVGGPVANIARTAASAQDRASQAVSLLVKGAERGAPAVQRSAAPLTSTLSAPLWDPIDEDPARARPKTAPAAKPARKDPQRLFEQRQEEILRATADPEATKREIAASVPAPPALANAIAEAAMRRFAFLVGVMPKDPRPPTLKPTPYQYPISDLSRFAEAVRAVRDPVGVIEAAFHDAVSPVAAEALRVVYPRFYQQVQEELIEQVASSSKPIPYNRKNNLGLVFDVPLDGTMTPDYRAARQAEYAMAAQASTPPAGGPQLSLSKQEELGQVRRAMR